MTKVSPSILAADFSKLGEEIKKVADAGADYIHIDVMDGTFVPNLSFGVPVIQCVRKVTDVPFDVHIMVEHPETYIQDLAKAGADIITFHVEAAKHPHRLIQEIKAAGCRAGISLNPGTSLASIEELLEDLDLILIMTVNPGFGGQKLIPGTLNKLSRLREALDRCGASAEIEVDGGVTVDNCQEIIDAGCDVLVAGSAVYKAADVRAAIKALHGKKS